MKFFTKVNRLIKMAAAAMVVGGTLLAFPGGAAHAATADCRAAYERGDNSVYLFSDINYQGECQRWTGTYAGNNLGDVGNDRASSLRILKPGGHMYIVSLYQNTNIGGAMYTVSGDDVSIPDFRNRTMTLFKNLNDRVSSISVSVLS